MAKVALNSFDIIAALDCSNRIAMTKVMDPSLWKADGGSQTLKVMIDGVRREMLPQFIGEHKAAVLPGWASTKAPLRLTTPLAAKQFHHEVGGCNPAPLIIFQGHKRARYKIVM